jgi:hypothetical protein
MTNQGREYISPSLPYVDPVRILAPNETYSTIERVSLVVPSQTRFKKYFSSFLFVIFLFYLIIQIILACYNCSFEYTNINWIRASFFLNIPFVFAVCIYIIRNIQTKKILSFTDFEITIMIYSLFFLFYLIGMGIYFEIDQLKQIQKTLGNTTIINFLPCSTNYYENIFRLKISQYFFIIICSFFSCLFCFDAELNDKKDAVKERCNQLISFIINQWRYFFGIIFQRHQGETVIQQY